MVKKAVIPAAGFGTRFLPATKSQPKEMLPVVDTPTIQYVVKEAIDSGINDILMIIGKGKRAIEEHFDKNFELEYQLEQQGKLEELEMIKSISSMADIHFVWQKEQNGLGDAIKYAQNHVGSEPFAVLLGDTVLESSNSIPVIKQLMNVYDRYEETVIALEEIEPEKVNRYGVIKGKEINDGVFLMEDIIEKPSIDKAPSNLVVASRYILTSEIFSQLEQITPGKNNEIQLTDALKSLLSTRAMYGYKFQGVRHDMGNKLDFLKTTIQFALKRKDIGKELREWLHSFLVQSK
jgi:UTP--glucose-1-phosphate uridylyltransferase